VSGKGWKLLGGAGLVGMHTLLSDVLLALGSPKTTCLNLSNKINKDSIN